MYKTKINKNSISALKKANKKRRLKIAGQKFGRLKAVSFVGIKNRRSCWKFKCDCGKETIKNTGHVMSGNTRSCGCLKRENSIKRFSTHGMSGSRFYNIWVGILKRCNNPRHKSYSLYGGKNIRCEWTSFTNFKKDMYKKYLDHIKKFGKKNTTIDRINNNKNYSKNNCRWTTNKEQARNIRTNHFITYKGKTQTLSAWVEETGVGHTTILYRLKSNWPIEKVLSSNKYKNQHDVPNSNN